VSKENSDIYGSGGLKGNLYGKYQESEDKKRKLFLRSAHKALDIGDDDMNISPKTTTTINGVGWKELLAVAAVGGAFYFGSQTSNIINVPSNHVGPVDSEYQVLFYDKDGNAIDVPRKPH